MTDSDFEALRRELLHSDDPSALSQGEFTVDWARAGHVLSRYQLADPYTYVLKWIQWAVCSGASEARVAVNRGMVSVEHDGTLFDKSRLTSIESFLGSGDSALLHLAVGCYAAYGLKPQTLVLDSGDMRRTLYGSPPQTLPPRTLPTRVLVMGLSTPLPDLSAAPMFFQRPLETDPAPLQADRSPWDFFRDFGSFLRPESAHVRLRAIYAPIPVWLNGRPVNRPWFGLSNGCEIQNGDLNLTPTIAVPYRAVAVLAYESGIPGSASCWMDDSYRCMFPTTAAEWPRDEKGLVPRTGLADEEIKKLWGFMPRLRLWKQRVIPCESISFYATVQGKYVMSTEIDWVKDGVIVARRVTPRDFPTGIRAIASAAGLTTDISQFQLVHDAAYDKALHRLRKVWGLP